MDVHLDGFDLADAFGDMYDQGSELFKSSMHEEAPLYKICCNYNNCNDIINHNS